MHISMSKSNVSLVLLSIHEELNFVWKGKRNKLVYHQIFFADLKSLFILLLIGKLNILFEQLQ